MPIDVHFSHVGFFVHDLDEMIGFYCRHFGLQVTDRGPLGIPGNPEIAFLSGDPSEHHQIAFIAGRDERQSTLQQISFRVGSLSELRQLKRNLEAEGIEKFMPLNHGNAWSIYFADPDRNTIECFVTSPFHTAQPVTDPLDLDLDDEAILAATREAYENAPDFQPMDQWREAFGRLLAQS
jgi:catechol 2,3-dioxygenase